MTASATATASTAEKIRNTQTQDNTPFVQKKSNIYTMAATRLAQNAQTLMVTAFVLTVFASVPVAAAGPCEIAERTCMAMWEARIHGKQELASQVANWHIGFAKQELLIWDGRAD